MAKNGKEWQRLTVIASESKTGFTMQSQSFPRIYANPDSRSGSLPRSGCRIAFRISDSESATVQDPSRIRDRRLIINATASSRPLSSEALRPEILKSRSGRQGSSLVQHRRLVSRSARPRDSIRPGNRIVREDRIFGFA